MPDVVVVGAGIVGAATAYYLTEAGARVEVLEASEVASGVTAASFVVDVTRVKTPRSLHDLALAAGDEHAALESAWGAAPWVHRVPTLEWADSAKDEARLRERVERLQGWGYPAEWVSQAEAEETEPALDLASTAPDEIAFFPEGAWYEPALLAHELLRRARSRGATLKVQDRVTELETGHGRISAVRTATGRRIHADVVVNCAGPEAAQLAALAGARLPLHRIPGFIATTASSRVRLRAILHAGDLNLRPDSGGRTVLHSRAQDAGLSDGAPNDMLGRAQHLLHQAREVVPEMAADELQETRVGVRPVPSDGLPLVGFTADVENFYVVVSHSAVHLAPLLGRLAARELTAGLEDRLESFRPDRFRDDDSEPVDESARTMLALVRGASKEPAHGR